MNNSCEKNKLPKVALILCPLLPVPAVKGGAVENLVQILLDENEKTPKFDFTVFSLNDEDAKREAKKYKRAKFIFISMQGWWNFLAIRLMFIINKLSPRYFGSWFSLLARKELLKDFYDLILIENLAIYAIPMRRKMPFAKIITHLHNRYVFCGCSREREIMGATDEFWCVSNYICEEVRSAEKGAEKNIYCLYNGIDISRFSTTISRDKRNFMRGRLGISEGDFVFLYSGRLALEKGVKELVEAFSIVEGCIPNAKLLISGDVKNLPSQILRKKRLSQNIIFSGRLPYEKMSEYLQLGDVAVLPTLIEEAFGLAFLEALCVGLPTIVTDAGGMVELAEGGNAIVVQRGEGLVERLAMAMLDLYAHPEKRHELSLKGKARAAGFSKENYWKRFVELAKRLCI